MSQPRTIQYFCPHWILHFLTSCAHSQSLLHLDCSGKNPARSQAFPPNKCQSVSPGRKWNQEWEWKKIKGVKKIRITPPFPMMYHSSQNQHSSCCCLCLKMDEEFPPRIHNSKKTPRSLKNSNVQHELLDGIIQTDSSAVSNLALAWGTCSIPNVSNNIKQSKRLTETYQMPWLVYSKLHLGVLKGRPHREGHVGVGKVVAGLVAH